MRTLDTLELELVGGGANTTSAAANGLGEEPKTAADTGKDAGNHYGWCRGLGNTERSMGQGGGLELPKHVDAPCTRPR